MTVDAAVFAACSILVATLVWQTQRLNNRRLRKIENDLDELRQLVSRVFAADLNWKSAQAVASRGDSAPGQRDQADPVVTPAPSPDLAPPPHLTPLPETAPPDLSEVDLLCAKLITLAPPAAALPLLTELESSVVPLRKDRGPRREGRQRLQPWPQR
jgi:hypothetical protein